MAPSDRNRRRRRRSPSRGRNVAIAAALALAVVALAVSLATTRSGREATSPTMSTDSGVAHVHGLGVNPKDGALYAATHTGLFRIPEQGKARRIADRYQDTMGFTVAGPDRFLGSGHPDVNDRKLRKPGRPPLLGLIESTDAGVTWNSLSLLGDVDFHALTAAHGRVYGFDATSGRFMVSNDMRAWETRSTTAIADFAVDPADPNRIVAATGERIIASVDGGRTWEPQPGPPLIVLSWDERSGLWGADTAGRVHRVATEGEWRNVGALAGEPQALLARDGAVYAAAADDGGPTSIYRSSDGRDWNLLYRDPQP